MVGGGVPTLVRLCSYRGSGGRRTPYPSLLRGGDVPRVGRIIIFVVCTVVSSSSAFASPWYCCCCCVIRMVSSTDSRYDTVQGNPQHSLCHTQWDVPGTHRVILTMYHIGYFWVHRSEIWGVHRWNQNNKQPMDDPGMEEQKARRT